MEKSMVKMFIKAVIPYGLILLYRFIKGSNYCPVCNKRTFFKPAGIISRPKAMCGYCGSLERHRFFWIFFKQKILQDHNSNENVLHIAAEPCLQKKLTAIYRGGST